jgi:hypothetical protein
MRGDLIVQAVIFGDLSFACADTPFRVVLHLTGLLHDVLAFVQALLGGAEVLAQFVHGRLTEHSDAVAGEHTRRLRLSRSHR